MTAVDPGPEQEGRLAATLFEDLLDRPEPPVPAVLAPVRERGRRLRRARRARAALLGAAFSGAAVLLVVNLAPGSGAVGPGTVRPSTGSPSATSPSTRPVDLEESYHRLWTAVMGAVPKQLSVMHLVPPGRTEILLTEAGSPSPAPGQPGVGVRLGVRGGLPVGPGQSTGSPCARTGAQAATECVHRVLGDNSSGWFASYSGPDARLEATFATPGGTVFGLSVINPPSGAALTLAELEELVSQAPVYMALRGTQETSPGGPSPQPSAFHTATPSGGPSGSPLGSTTLS
ncbi:hypothetical protein [Kitasatospora sp. P5_F3]